jgi:hypothetical protein
VLAEAGPSVRAGVGEVLSEQQQYMVDEIVQMGFERRKTEKAVRAVGDDCTDLEVLTPVRPNMLICVEQMMVLHLCEMEDEGEEGEEDESVVPMVPAAHRDAQYMSPLHLFGIANVLRRPLVLVSAKSEWAVSNSGDAISSMSVRRLSVSLAVDGRSLPSPEALACQLRGSGLVNWTAVPQQALYTLKYDKAEIQTQ